MAIRDLTPHSTPFSPYPPLLLFSIPNCSASQEADSTAQYADLQYISNTFAEKVAISSYIKVYHKECHCQRDGLKFVRVCVKSAQKKVGHMPTGKISFFAF